MRITPQLSIKNKAYLLVLMSVAVALILSFVTYSGLQAIRTELDELVTSTDIERHTGKLIQEEQRYRLSANGSVYDFAAAFQAHDNAMRQLNELSQTFDKVDELVMHGDDKLFIDIQKTRQCLQL